jgi:hypothetical protein
MRGFDVPIINPSTGASEYGANISQWDWKPFDTAMKAAKTTYDMVQGNKEEKRQQEEMEMEKLLFPSKQKAAELQLTKLQSEINENNARAEALLGQADADGLAVYGGSLNNDRLSPSGVYFPASLNPRIPKQKSPASASSSNAAPINMNTTAGGFSQL